MIYRVTAFFGGLLIGAMAVTAGLGIVGALFGGVLWGVVVGLVEVYDAR